MITREELASIGKFHKTHALKGELNAVLEIDGSFLDSGHPLIIDVEGIFVPFYCESVRPKGQFSSLVKLDGVDSEEEARNFVNKEIFALKGDLSEFEEEDSDENEEGSYAEDFVGFSIYDTESKNLIGEITGLDLSTANALFIVENEGEKMFIPIAEEFINEIDEPARIIYMSLPDGLIDINKKA